MKIYDCFSYLDEDFLLSLRLKILNNYIDYFVIIEGDKTWQNNKKELSFDIEKFKEFKEKIIYIPVTNMPEGDNPYLRENFQRDAINRGLVNAGKDDLIIISDLDEIPNPEVFKNFKQNMRYAVFKQMHFYYKFNLQSKTYPFWYGSKICIKKYLNSPQWLRQLKFKKRPWWRFDKKRLNNILENGGWHFCNLKDPKNLLYKYKNLCETNDQYVFKEKIDQRYLNESEITKNINLGKDLIGRNHEYLRVDIDSNFPKYLINNKEKYKDWIK